SPLALRPAPRRLPPQFTNPNSRCRARLLMNTRTIAHSTGSLAPTFFSRTHDSATIPFRRQRERGLDGVSSRGTHARSAVVSSSKALRGRALRAAEGPCRPRSAFELEATALRAG